MSRNLSPFPDGSLVLFPDEVVSDWRLPASVKAIPLVNGQSRLGVPVEQLGPVCRALEIEPRELVNGGLEGELDGVFEAYMPASWYLRHQGGPAVWRQRYLEFCGYGGTQPRLRQLTKRQLDRLESERPGLEAKLAAALEAERRSQENLWNLLSDRPKAPAGSDQLRRLLECREIEDVEIGPGDCGPTMTVFTAPIRLSSGGSKQLMGTYRIRLDRFGNLSIHNTLIRIQKDFRHFDHPHVEDGHPCLGNIKKAVLDMLRSGQMVSAVFAILELLKSFNPDDHFWMGDKAVLRWPKWGSLEAREKLAKHHPRISPLNEPERWADLCDRYSQLAGLDSGRQKTGQPAARRAVNLAARSALTCQQRLGQALISLASQNRPADEGRQTAEQELDRFLRDRPEVERIVFDDNRRPPRTLKVVTKVMVMTVTGEPDCPDCSVRLGRLELCLDRTGQGGGLTVRNPGETVDGCPHPYVDSLGRVRSPNILLALPHLIAERQYLPLLEMVLDFLQSPEGSRPAVEPRRWAEKSGR